MWRSWVLVMPEFAWNDWAKQERPVRISDFQIRIRHKWEALLNSEIRFRYTNSCVSIWQTWLSCQSLSLSLSLWHTAIQLGRQMLMFRRNLVPPSSGHLILIPLRWRQQITSKCWYVSTNYKELHPRRIVTSLDSILKQFYMPPSLKSNLNIILLKSSTWTFPKRSPTRLSKKCYYPNNTR